MRSFLPKKNTSFVEILGEWCRLWESYRNGLFQYAKFPIVVKTNNGCKTSFSQEKQDIYRRVGKKKVGHMVESRGESYLRLHHCEKEEMQADIVQEYSKLLIKRLQEVQQEKISEITKYWRKKDLKYQSYKEVIRLFYPDDIDNILEQYDEEI